MHRTLPERSVTRFLLPLADIMILLFSFFLLLPHLEQQPGQLTGQAVTAGSFWTPEEQRRIREELARLRRQSLLPVGDRLHVVILEIDGDTGDLILPQGFREVRLTEMNLDEIIKRQKAAAKSLGKAEVFYLLRVPRPGPDGAVKPHPDIADEARYRSWFLPRKQNYRVDHVRLVE